MKTILSFVFCISIAFVALRAVADSPNSALASYVIDNGGIAAALTAMPGDAAAGKLVVADRKLGNCYSCHSFGDGAPDPGNVGPSLAGVGSQFSAPMLRLRIVDPKAIDPQTIMPAYYRVGRLRDVGTKFVGKPILTAQQVEDLVAYLSSLK